LHDQDWGESILQNRSHRGRASVEKMCGLGLAWEPEGGAVVVVTCLVAGASYVFVMNRCPLVWSLQAAGSDLGQAGRDLQGP